ncbi:hypothetical protein AZE42_05494 [Rhizopogon vesiculosus]|uniref:Uncharacterized protein n=1 Tax=Rhizopogon vesiculosus TaxID=180088 RepID=A0A1J8Q7W8_9AGAM|nr:hypothetical protein AZE42_05494 [Rhizopogon vesiculosus]
MRHLTAPALSEMSTSACTSPFAPFEDINMAEVKVLSLFEPPDDNPLKQYGTKISLIRMCPEFYVQQSPEVSLVVQEVFSQRSAEAPSSQHHQPFKSLSNQELSRSFSASQSQSQSQSQQSNGHRRKHRRLEGDTTVTGSENSGVVRAPSVVSTLGCRKTNEFVIDNPSSGSEASPRYRSPSIVSTLGCRKTNEFVIDNPSSGSEASPRYRSRAPSPDPVLDVGHAADESVSPSREHQQCRPALRPGSLAPNRSAPLPISPRRLPGANAHSRSYRPRAISTSALNTLNSPRALAPAPTIPLLLGITPTRSSSPSSKISQPINPLVSGNPSSSDFASSSILRTSTPPVAISGKSSLSRSEERRKRREIAEK